MRLVRLKTKEDCVFTIQPNEAVLLVRQNNKISFDLSAKGMPNTHRKFYGLDGKRLLSEESGQLIHLSTYKENTIIIVNLSCEETLVKMVYKD